MLSILGAPVDRRCGSSVSEEIRADFVSLANLFREWNYTPVDSSDYAEIRAQILSSQLRADPDS